MTRTNHFQGCADDTHFTAFVHRGVDDHLKRDADPTTGLVGGLAVETKAGRAAGSSEWRTRLFEQFQRYLQRKNP